MGSLIPRATAILLIILATAPPISAQFGKNKIQYDRFNWKIYASPHFDVHYYPEAEEFVEEVVSYAESAYLKISQDLDHELRFRVPLIIYKTHAEFEQTNIILSDIPEAVGAFAEPVQNRMVLPIDLPPDELYALIAHELTHIFEYSLLFEGNLGRAFRANPPTWFMEGLASYLADDETNLDRMAIRDAVVNNILPPIQALNVVTFLTYRYGHAVFDFIEQEHGKEGLRTFIFEFRKVLLSNNVGKAVQEAFGVDLDEFNRQFNRYLRKKYFPVLLEKKSPDDYGTEIGIRNPGVFTFSPTPSPSGELIAALSSVSRLELDLVVLSADDGEKVRNLTKGFTNRYQTLVAESFAGKRDVSWSPAGDLVAVFARRERGRVLLVYNALTGRLVHDIPLGDIGQGASPSFAPDGTRIAFEGNRGGVVDIFEIELETREIRNLTEDSFFDANPWYSPDGKQLLYNRRIGEFWKVFWVDLEDPSRKVQLTFGQSSDIQPSYSRDGNTIFFASDRSPYGVFNIYSLDLGSGEVRQFTDVVGGCFAPVELAEREGDRFLGFVSYYQGTFRLYRMPLAEPEAVITSEERLENPIDAEPFEPPLRLTLDESQKSPYKVRWDIDAPIVNVGVANDGTFIGDVILQFSDLLGDRRIQIIGSSIAGFSNFQAYYLNLKNRYNWGARVYDLRDFFVTASGRDQTQRATGGEFFFQLPLNRYYRLETAAGASDTSQDFLTIDPATGLTGFVELQEQYGVLRLDLVGDTTRYQSFGPFQGKRFRLGVLYGPNINSDVPEGLNVSEGDIVEYQMDFRAYRKATRRSLLAWRLAGIYNVGERVTYLPLGGINQLRGYEFREFFGSRVAWSNLEFRFPLADELRFPILSIVQIRGFFFFDVGAAWFEDNTWYDPDLNNVRIDPKTGQPIEFKFWDSENNRLQDGRAAYGLGFQFLFLGGLQFNWSWSNRLPYTQYVPVFDPLTFRVTDLVPTEIDGGGTRTDFYIIFDW